MNITLIPVILFSAVYLYFVHSLYFSHVLSKRLTAIKILSGVLFFVCIDLKNNITITIIEKSTEHEECSGSSDGADGTRGERGVYAAPWWCGNWILLHENDDHWTRIPPGRLLRHY